MLRILSLHSLHRTWVHSCCAIRHSAHMNNNNLKTVAPHMLIIMLVITPVSEASADFSSSLIRIRSRRNGFDAL